MKSSHMNFDSENLLILIRYHHNSLMAHFVLLKKRKVQSEASHYAGDAPFPCAKYNWNLSDFVSNSLISLNSVGGSDQIGLGSQQRR